MSPALVRRAILATGITPQAKVLLTYMTDVASDEGLFYELRANTIRRSGLPAATVTKCMRSLIALGYVTEVSPARKNKHPRVLRLHPGLWIQPADVTTAEQLTLSSLMGDQFGT